MSNNEGIQLKRLFDVSNVAKSTYHYSLTHNVIEKKDEVIVQVLMKLPEEQLRQGTKHKMSFLKDMGIEVKYKRLLRICNKYGFLSKIRRLRYPKGYYAKHKQ